MTDAVHDSEYFHRRAAEARAAASCKDQGEAVEIAGELALAYAAMARRRAAAAASDAADPPMLLQDPAAA